MSSTPPGKDLTRHVAAFVVATQAKDLPADVIALGRKSLLDGLGLAISGNVTEMGELVRKHLESLHVGSGPSSVIGTRIRTAPRFAAFAKIGRAHV